jgi:hypothetical protein
MHLKNLTKKKYLFWDVSKIDPYKNAEFIIQRILQFGDIDDLRWALNFYGEEKIKEIFLKVKRKLDKKSLNFWKLYFNFK